jgi:hypothetical protein
VTLLFSLVFCCLKRKKILHLDVLLPQSVREPDVYNRPLHFSDTSLPPTHPYYNSLSEVT